MTPLMRENHQRTAHGVRLDDAPLMLADVFAWNKVYRRSFWDAHDLSFPVGVRYEDQPTLTKALVAASRFDVLAEPVYRWRVRSDGSSISQQRADPRDLSDRILTKRWSTDLLERGVRGHAGRVVPAGAADRHVGVLPRRARLLGRVLVDAARRPP